MAPRRKHYIVMVADIVESRAAAGRARAALQENIEGLIGRLNRRYRGQLQVGFSTTAGDEFQGVLRAVKVIPDLLWDVDNDFRERRIRVGIGFGAIDTAFRKTSSSMDGPAFHRAREAIIEAHKEHELGGVFRGFGAMDPVLNGVARLLWYRRSRWTDRQNEVAAWIRAGKRQSEIAEILGISKQAVSNHVKRGGLVPYADAENALRILLGLATTEDAP
jgi:hypothetical protein